MKLSFFSFFLLVNLVAGSQVITDSILIEGHYRSFHFNKPAVSTGDRSLLFVMHGSGGNGKRMMSATAKLEAIAAKENLLIVYPDGYKNYWNECRKYASSDANKENINDNAFFHEMIGYFRLKYNINKEKIFAAGFSGGGHMAYKLGLTMAGEIRAIAAIVANMPDSASSDCVFTGKPLPVLIINGTADNVNPYNGGEMFVNNSSYGVVRSTEKSFHYWSSLAGYTGEPVKTVLPDADPADQKIIEEYRYTAKGRPSVTLLKVVGGKHDYPGDTDVYLYAWEFFKSQAGKPDVSKKDPLKPVLLVEAACGECQFKLPGRGCDLAVRVDGKAWFVDGTSIDDHGDAHAKDGFCEAVRKAEVQGEFVNGRFWATYFQLLKEEK
ncbi:MAG: poly(3-hydroxybutyrate) depolymerase [Chitinophagales bacterium]|nr:poly(3-hydroxybutyrate) depolymerase [Chitinophagales bacterium]